MRQQTLGRFGKHLRRGSIAGCPVVDVGQKRLDAGKRRIKVSNALQQKAVEIVFFIIGVRQAVEKVLPLFGFCQRLGVFAQRGRAHADDRIVRHRRHQRRLKVFVAFVLHGKKRFQNGHKSLRFPPKYHKRYEPAKGSFSYAISPSRKIPPMRVGFRYFSQSSARFALFSSIIFSATAAGTSS